ncbi:hypothetical protein [Vineibacter terrae]|uniref:hypothetical protein n=1 Tax=Vineibacter terrae TaxID=2586908 RepID=UPI002E324623|nr:hypothetical protein [Vineibacter terrae]HEX2885969.1 hypothetical protein [Vineibacter terrae]
MPASALAALFATLRSALGRIAVIDMSLPAGRSAGIDREVVFGSCGRPAPEQTFLGRFRQSGGHRDVYALAAADRDSPARANLLDTVDRSRKVVFFADSMDQVEPIADLVDDGRSLVLCLGGHRSAVVPPALASWLKQRRVIALTPADAAPVFLWIVPAAAYDVLCRQLPLAPASPTPAKRLAAADRTIAPHATLVLAVPADAPSQPVLVAGALIHDGGYRSESEGDYSWLWTGPSKHFRVLLTGFPATATKLNVSIIKTEDPRNLSGLRVLIDGRHVGHRFSPWSDVSGKVTVDLAAPVTDMTVLSLVCPHMVPDGSGHRHLGLCIDRIEFAA